MEGIRTGAEDDVCIYGYKHTVAAQTDFLELITNISQMSLLGFA